MGEILSFLRVLFIVEVQMPFDEVVLMKFGGHALLLPSVIAPIMLQPNDLIFIRSEAISSSSSNIKSRVERAKRPVSAL